MADGFAKTVWDGVIELIAHSATFQAWTGGVLEPTEEQTNVRDFIDLGSTARDAAKPRALIHPGELKRETMGYGVEVLGESEVRISLLGKVDAAYVDEGGAVNDWNAMLLALESTASNVLDEIKASSRTGGIGPNVNEATLSESPEIDSEDRRALGVGDDAVENGRDLLLTIGFRPAEGV